jgi:hypothetical protein
MELQKQAMAFGDFRLKFAERIGQTTRQYRKLLASPGTESADEAKEIQEEFSPDEPPLETVTENSEYGLLEGDQSTTPDDAPTPQDAGDEQPVPPDILPDSEVQQNANHAEPESSGESAESAEMPVEEQLIALMKEVNDDGGFFSVCHRAAMAGKYDKTLEEVSAAVTVYCKLRMSKPGPPHKLTMDGKRRLVRQLISGVFVFPTIPPSQPRPAVGTATGQ